MEKAPVVKKAVNLVINTNSEKLQDSADSFPEKFNPDDLEALQTSKSQPAGVFKWANISGVQDVVSGAVSGLSAYIGWANQNSDGEKVAGAQVPEEQKGQFSVEGLPYAFNDTQDIVSASVYAPKEDLREAVPSALPLGEAAIELGESIMPSMIAPASTIPASALTSTRLPAHWEPTGNSHDSTPCGGDYETEVFGKQSEIILERKSPTREDEAQIPKQPSTSRPSRLLSSENNDIFMKQVVGNMGKLHGVNLEKLRKTHLGNSQG